MSRRPDSRRVKDLAWRGIAVGCLIILLWQAYESRDLPLLLTAPIWWTYLYGGMLRAQWRAELDRNDGVPDPPGELADFVERLRAWVANRR